MFKEILLNRTVTEFLDLLEKNGYKQVIKSKTRSTETSIITQDAFFNLVNNMTEIRLNRSDIELL